SQRYWQYGKTAGFEALKEFGLPEVLSEEVIALKKNMDKGVKQPKGSTDVVVAPQITGIIVHESGGHPYEADRILGREAAQAGESFISTKSVGMQLGSRAVNITDDPTIPNSFGFYLYDDEGIKASRKYLMKEGRISGLLHCRETAAAMKTVSNASARASAYDREAIVRMSNTVIEPGDCSEEELIEGVKKGVYMKTFSEWNIDDRRVNQKYVGADAYLIKNGRIASPVIRPTLEITTFALYRAIDAVANNVEHHAGSCGKGEPMQAIPVSFGGPSMRIRGVAMR
ncbi:TldD/PmbA family protein, partial [Candidatus Woesearchaeota archaeon]|nr:TldD/PmbA family protein [Candidatus Woesearchaeota archaeon]